jgi:hypothetical protein
VKSLDNLFPSRRIAANAASNQQPDNLGIIQNRLRQEEKKETIESIKKYKDDGATGVPARPPKAQPEPVLNSTTQLRFCKPRSSLES